MSFPAKRSSAALALALALSSPMAWARSPSATVSAEPGPVHPDPPCLDYSVETGCKPCWIEPWLCHPPAPPPPCHRPHRPHPVEPDAGAPDSTWLPNGRD
jgi:hypothetical protein